MGKSSGKIAYISDRFPHITETFTYYEVMGLKKEGLDIQVYSFKKPDVSHLTSEMKEEIKYTIYFPGFLVLDIYLSQLYFLYHIPLRYFHTMLKVIFGKYQRFTTLKLRLRCLVNFLRGVHLAFLLKDKRDSVHIHAQFASNASTTGYISNSLLDISFSFKSHTGYNPLIIKDKIVRARFILSSSEYDKRRLLEWSNKIFSNKIEVIYQGVNIGRWKVDKEKTKKGLIVAVGRLVEKKGFDYLIKAVEILKDRGLNFSMKVGGGGPLRNELEELIEKKGLRENIEILGYVSHDEVKELVERASIFCQPCVVASNADVDVFPVTSMEAMALEKPVVSTNVSAIPEGIDNGINGILVPPKDSFALANALEKLLKDFKLRESLGKAARKKIERDFSLQKNIRKTASVFREYIDG